VILNARILCIKKRKRLSLSLSLCSLFFLFDCAEANKYLLKQQQLPIYTKNNTPISILIESGIQAVNKFQSKRKLNVIMCIIYLYKRALKMQSTVKLTLQELP
jgi:hypothetical protein